MKKSILILIFVITLFISACENKDIQSPDIYEYIISIEEQSKSIKSFLEHDALTQTDMNMKSQELYELWDNALNFLWDELKVNLSQEDFEKLLDEQRIWIAEKEKMIQEAGNEVKGGSIYLLVVNSEAAQITEERVYELYEILKKL